MLEEKINRILENDANTNKYSIQIVVQKVQRHGGLHPFNKEAYVDLRFKLLNKQTKELSKLKAISYNRGAMIATSVGFSFEGYEDHITELFQQRQERYNEQT